MANTEVFSPTCIPHAATARPAPTTRSAAKVTRPHERFRGRGPAVAERRSAPNKPPPGSAVLRFPEDSDADLVMMLIPGPP